MVEVAENELAALKEKLATKESQVRDARGGVTRITGAPGPLCWSPWLRSHLARQDN